MENGLQAMTNNLPSIASASAAVEQSRAIAETQAAMVVAMSRPRDEGVAFTKIMTACGRQSLAASAMYAYRRGGTLVEGPSIRLAEVLARHWGNITYGMRELSRDPGSSEIEAFAWDLETNTRVTRQFVVRHQRDTKKGAKKLTEERDIYELGANMGQRRVRACLLELIPGDIVEEATLKCKKTLADGDGKPLEDRVRDMLVAFQGIGITKPMIEAYLSHKVEAVVPAQLVKLTQIYKSINDGVAPREEFFDLKAGSGPDAEKPEGVDKMLNGEGQPQGTPAPEKPKTNKKSQAVLKKEHIRQIHELVKAGGSDNAVILDSLMAYKGQSIVGNDWLSNKTTNDLEVFVDSLIDDYRAKVMG